MLIVLNGSANQDATMAGDYVSRCVSAALCYSIANSMNNNKDKNFIPIEIEALKNRIEQIVRTLNELGYDEQEMI